MASIQVFLIVSTCFLYLVAAGLFSKSVWYFENYKVREEVAESSRYLTDGAVGSDHRRRRFGDGIRTWVVRHPPERLAY